MIHKIIIVFIFVSTVILAETADSSAVLSPKKAAQWAFLFPGAGQAYNGKYLKASLILGAEIAAIWRFSENNRMVKTYSIDYSLSENRYLEKRNKYAWWIFFTYIYGVLDAVVDAHLAPFDEIMAEDLESSQIENQTTEMEND